MDPILLQAVEQTFPKLDKAFQQTIYHKVLAHMMEVLKKEIYLKDINGLNALTEKIETEPDYKKRQVEYITQILEKFASLPENERAAIGHTLEEELTRVMHEIYKAYE